MSAPAPELKRVNMPQGEVRYAQFSVTGECCCMWSKDCPIHKLVGTIVKLDAPVRLMERRWFVPRVIFRNIESTPVIVRKLFVRYI